MKKHRQSKNNEIIAKIKNQIIEAVKKVILGTIVVDKKGRLHWGDQNLIIAAKGAPGKTPVKGVDYEDGETPVKGVDYFDGKTPVKGVDYFDGKTPRKNIDYKDGEDGDSPIGLEHQWSMTKIRFQNPDGTWGKWVDLKGEPGKAPVKGEDYFDGEPGKTPVKGEDYHDGKTPVKGEDYDDGKDGHTPKKGEDYFDGEPGYTPVKGKDYDDGKEGDPGDPGEPGIAPNDVAIILEEIKILKKQVAELQNVNN